MSTVLKSFDRWKEFLGDRLTAAERKGMSDETVTKLATQIGGFLADKIDPQNPEERVLKELWDLGDESERKAIARLMLKWVSKS
jgi:hypothetical protein